MPNSWTTVNEPLEWGTVTTSTQTIYCNSTTSNSPYVHWVYKAKKCYPEDNDGQLLFEFMGG